MIRIRISNREFILLATAIGLIATLSAPWLELRGTFQSWRIVEWHTFWRGQSAFMLADLVAVNYTAPVEFATSAMRETVRLASFAGAVIAIWHSAVLFALLTLGATARLRRGVARGRVAVEMALIVLTAGIVLYVLAVTFALPSALSPKVDFRAPADLHSDSLVWSSVNVFPVAPALSLLAAAGQLIAIYFSLRARRGPRSSPLTAF